MTRRWVWALLVGLSVHLSSWSAFAQCTKDIECKGDRVCTEGVCAEPVRTEPVVPARTEPVAPSPTVVTVVTATPQPAAPLPPVPTSYRRRKGLLVTGIVLSSVGVAALIAATALGAVEASCNRDLHEKYPDNVVSASGVDEIDRCQSYSTPLEVFLIGGIVLTGAGVPLLIVGAKKIPVYSARATLTPWLTPRAGGLSLQLQL